MNEGSAKQQIVEAIKANSNILVTVSDSPSVDELSAALGLTILLNKLDKRATSIFSGAIPPAITFLDPEKTLEGTVDSLRDFIIALDKEKADHLRYKVEGDVVKIFITPYRTTLTEKDLQFSQGDYNVELVIALGVKDPDHLDKALSAHGRILHDAVVATISAGQQPSTLGSIDWRDAAASSLCEMLLGLSEALKDDQPILDEQIATAFLTGIVSATDRFSNDRTSPRVMTMSAQLMAAGANQQLIAAKLQEAHDISPAPQPARVNSDGTTSIAEGKSAKVDKDKKSDKKPKKDDGKDDSKNDGLKINRDKKPDEKLAKPDKEPAPVAVPAPITPPPSDEAASIDDQLAKQLDTVIEPSAQPPADLAQELDAAAKQEPAPHPAVQSEPESADIGMPGFETLGLPPLPPPPTIDSVTAPAPEPAAPVPSEAETQAASTPPAAEKSGFIESRPGSSYVAPGQTAPFDAPVDGIISGQNTPAADTAAVDPFSVPLSPLPDLHESKDVSPSAALVDESALPATPQPPANVTADTGLPPFEELAPPLPAMPPAATDDASLPPLPDFPPPPPPPIFGQASPSVPTQAGALSADKLGDIFGDTSSSAPAAPTPTPPPAPAKPASPAQFKIPGQ